MPSKKSVKKTIERYDYYSEKHKRVILVREHDRTYYLSKKGKKYPINPAVFGNIDRKEAKSLDWLTEGNRIDVNSPGGVYGIKGVGSTIGTVLTEEGITINDLQKREFKALTPNMKPVLKHESFEIPGSRDKWRKPYMAIVKDGERQWIDIGSDKTKILNTNLPLGAVIEISTDSGSHCWNYTSRFVRRFDGWEKIAMKNRPSSHCKSSSARQEAFWDKVSESNTRYTFTWDKEITNPIQHLSEKDPQPEFDLERDQKRKNSEIIDRLLAG